MVIYPPLFSAFASPAVVVSSIRRPVLSFLSSLLLRKCVRPSSFFPSYVFFVCRIVHFFYQFFCFFPCEVCLTYPGLEASYLCCTYLVPGDGAHIQETRYTNCTTFTHSSACAVGHSEDIRRSKLKISGGRGKVELHVLFALLCMRGEYQIS